MKTQLELQLEIVAKSGINIVTCGNCGDVLFHEITDEVVTCPYCKFESDPCNFPDYNY